MTNIDTALVERALEPCPFCGCAMYLDYDVKSGMFGPEGEHANGCMFKSVDLLDFADEHHAVLLWNTRALQSTREKKLEEALRKAAERFREYEASHTEKLNTEHRPQAWGEIYKKAERNREMAEMCEAALSNPEGEREALPVGGEWRPIETAIDSEDGILICDATKPTPAVGVARYMDGQWRGFHFAYQVGCQWPTPTHWMPLPPPPAQQPAVGEESGE